MAIQGIRYDDGSGAFTSSCFPVRGLIRAAEEGDGAWLVAHRAEQRRRFKAVLCAKPTRVYTAIPQTQATEKLNPVTAVVQQTPAEEESVVLDGFFLIKHCCIDDPADLCSVNVCGQNLGDAKEEDFALFDNVAYVNAGENFLPFGAFRGFPILRELEMPLNGVRAIRFNIGDFPLLEVLDLSYNNVSHEDILRLGHLPSLRVLHLTGNNLRELPVGFSHTYLKPNREEKVDRFPQLEILLLDDNKLSNLTTFSALAGLKRLRQLNLSKNQISTIPQLTLVGGVLSTDSPIEKTKRSSSGRHSRNSARKSPISQAPQLDPSEGVNRSDSRPEIDVESGHTNHPPPPFPELISLDLSNNKICEEEAILAVAAWPMLAEILIHNNPLTTLNSGDPPLLKSFLDDRLGITVVRKQPKQKGKPYINVPNASERRVNSRIPPIPRCNPDLMLEAPPPRASPLPPIATPTDKVCGGQEVIDEEEGKPEEDAFFMTQVEDQFSSMNVDEQKEHLVGTARSRPKKDSVPDKYKGYEILLDIEDDPDTYIPSDIQGNTRALQYALRHPTVYKESIVELHKVQKPFHPYRKSVAPAGPPRVTSQEKVDSLLNRLKTNTTVIEESLTSALARKGKNKSQSSEAEQLLGEVQKRYNAVRSSSMKDAKVAKEVLTETLAGLKLTNNRK